MTVSKGDQRCLFAIRQMVLTSKVKPPDGEDDDQGREEELDQSCGCARRKHVRYRHRRGKKDLTQNDDCEQAITLDQMVAVEGQRFRAAFG